MNFTKNLVFSKTNIFIFLALIIIVLFVYLVYINLKLTPDSTIKPIVKNETDVLNISNKTIKHKINGYEVIEIYDVLTEEECNELIEMTKKSGLSDSIVLSYNKDKTKLDSSHRKSKQGWFLDSHHQILAKLAAFNSLITGLPVENQEMTQIAMYEKEGKFNEHYDACNSNDKVYCDDMNRHAGERKQTLLVYLNDDYTDGETEFTKINLKIKPKKGMGIFFRNVDDKEEILPLSMHKANIITNGEKWIATKWTHFKEYK